MNSDDISPAASHGQQDEPRLIDLTAPNRSHRESADRIDRLHACVSCKHELVYPLLCVQEGPKYWRMTLRCPDCETDREGLFTQEAVDSFTDVLDRGERRLLNELARLARERMHEEVEFFIRALNADLILPSDFRHWPASEGRS
jgi:hypothetical protein